MNFVDSIFSCPPAGLTLRAIVQHVIERKVMPFPSQFAVPSRWNPDLQKTTSVNLSQGNEHGPCLPPAHLSTWKGLPRV